MLVRQRARSVVLRVVLVAVMAAGLTACGGQSDDQPTPLAESPSQQASPSPTEEAISPEEQAKQDKLASAVARYEEYLAVRTKYAQRGENGFKPLLNNGFYGTQSFMDAEARFWSGLTKDDLKQTGASKVVDAELVKLTGGALAKITKNLLIMDVCVDAGQVDVVRPDGSSALTSKPGRRILRLEMQGRDRADGPEGYWTIAKAETKEKC